MVMVIYDNDDELSEDDDLIMSQRSKASTLDGFIHNDSSLHCYYPTQKQIMDVCSTYPEFHSMMNIRWHWCFPHILNLIVKSLHDVKEFGSVYKVIDGLSNFLSSTQYIRKIWNVTSELMNEIGAKTALRVSIVPTRWQYLIDVISSFIEHANTVNRVLLEVANGKYVVPDKVIDAARSLVPKVNTLFWGKLAKRM